MAGEFTFTITSEQLSRGLRPSKRMPRDSKYLVEAKGAIGRDGVLCAVDSLTRLNTSVITDAFPFPQMFVFTNHIVVCGASKIYEYVNGTLVLKLTTTAWSTWTAVDFYDYIYLSNGKVAVIRNADTGVYSVSSTLPTAMSILNFNGQVVIGALGIITKGAGLSIKASPLVVSTSQLGSWS